MIVDLTKFRMMFLGKKVDTKFHLNMNGKVILEGEEVKLLGVTIRGANEGVWGVSHPQ